VTILANLGIHSIGELLIAMLWLLVDFVVRLILNPTILIPVALLSRLWYVVVVKRVA